MRGTNGWTTGAAALLLAASVAGPLGAQEEGPEEGEVCACVDRDEVRAEVRTAMERAHEELEHAREEIERAREHARDEVQRAREQVREEVRDIRIRHGSRARLGVGISYE